MDSDPLGLGWAMVKRKRGQLGTTDVATLRRHLQQKPDDGQAWLALARALLEQAPGPELPHAVGQCLRYLPDNHQAWLLAAAVQQRSRGDEAALEWLEQAAARNAYRSAPHLALAKLRLNRFQLVEALAVVNRAIAISGETPQALSIRGDINLQGRHWDEALSDFRRVEKSGANDAQLMHQIGCCYFGLEDHRAAEAHFRKAITRDPRQLKSRFTLALSLLHRMESEKGEAILKELVRDPETDPQVRNKAAIALAVLAERRRLETPLRQALESGEVNVLQAALNDTPGTLLRRDDETSSRFQHLAAIFRDHSFDPGTLSPSGDAGPRALLEAETLCTADIDAATLAALYPSMSDSQAGNASADRKLLDAWQTVRDRARFDAGQLYGANGESWARYWHARLLKATPEAHPGQFKAVDAALPGKPRISPEFIVPLCRELLGQLAAELPAGVPRALFLYVSLRVLQPFSDGNSRLARFLMNAELQSSGQPTLVIPASWSSQLNSRFDAVLFEGRLEPLIEALAAAQDDAASQLRCFD